MKGLDLIFQPGYEYMKAGIIASDLITDKVVQQNIFTDVNQVKNKQLMETMDTVNKTMGKEIVRMAVQGFSRRYRLRAEYLSPKYTTRETDFLKVKCN